GRTAGIVMEDVELAVAGNGCLDGGFDAGALGYIAAQKMGVAAAVGCAFARGASCSLAGSLIDIGDHDLGPLLGKPLGRGPADAPPAPVYESTLADGPPHRRPFEYATAMGRGTNPAPPRATPAHGRRASPRRAYACRCRRQEADRPLAGRPRRDRCGCRGPFARPRPDSPRTWRSRARADMRARRR